MSDTFVNKRKPTASEYLNASLEEIIERANKSTSESEIPFVTALLSAKAYRDQKSISTKMFWTSIATAFIALFSLMNNYLDSKSKAETEKEIAFVRTELSSLQSKSFNISTQLQSAIHKISVLEKEREAFLKNPQSIHELSQKAKPYPGNQSNKK
ncbi:MAG: hypothetical protein V4525_17435 [Pseudomonadota bacterium]